MPTENRRKSLNLIQQLLANPADYSFFQSVRLLERAALLHAQEKGLNPPNPVARFTPPQSEVLRFAQQLSMGFPGSEVAKIEQLNKPAGDQLPAKGQSKEQHQFLMLVNFIGTAGSTGVLPFHYTELIYQRLKLKDSGFKKFLDLFHHRTTSLFFQAGVKYRLPLAYERHHLKPKRGEYFDSHTHSLLSILGMGTPHMTDGLGLKPESLIYYSGLLGQQVKSASNLKQFISSFFGVPIKIEEFVGKWHDLISDVRSRLPSPGQPKGQNVCLGRSVILGGKGWFAQGKTRVVIGPLNQEQYKRFAPGTAALKQLDQVVKLFAGAENECEFVLKVGREHLPKRIQLSNKRPPIMGWDTWLASKNLAEGQKADTLDITVSTGRLQ